MNGRPAVVAAVLSSAGSRNGRTTPGPGSRGDAAWCFRRGERAGSAKTPPFLMARVRKSLILEKTTATSPVLFATSRVFSAMSRFFVSAVSTPLPSLSKLLKKKKKEALKREKTNQTACHESMVFCHHSDRLPIF